MDLSDFSYVIAAIGGWLLAQLVKIVLSLGQDGISWQDLFTSGGMPSSHVALVTTTMMVIGLDQGFSSAIFGVMATLWGIVVYDAMGVRQATGENTKIIQRIMKQLKLGDQKRAYFLAIGHTPYQVLGGFVVGIVWGAAAYWLLF